MNFHDYAKCHGLIIDRIIEDGHWHRVRTTDKPKHHNGSYKFVGDFAVLQNHATMTEVAIWRPDENEAVSVDHAALARRAKAAADEIRVSQERAARKSAWVMHQCKPETHPYLAEKGFPDEIGNVWTHEGVRKLVIPMMADGRLVGMQTISDQEGFEKRFQYGQRTSEAVYVMDARGPKFYAEGYATSLSLRAALQALKVRYTIIVCFTAGNLLKVARNHAEGIVIADNDMPSPVAPEPGGMGLKVAKETGLPYWLSDRAPEDLNDYMVRCGLFRTSQSLKALMMRQRRTA
jgi:putative DNA primase/helicase